MHVSGSSSWCVIEDIFAAYWPTFFCATSWMTTCRNFHFLELCRWKSLSETHNLRNCFNKSPNNSLQVNRVTMLPRRQGNLTIRLSGPPGNVETPSAWTWFIWIPIINGANTHFKLVAVLNPELLVARWNTTKFLGEVIAAWY